MKTYTNLMEKVCAYGNLLLAYRKASLGKRGRPEVAAFFYGLEKNLFSLKESLLDGTWTPGPYRTFTIYEPKKRTIMAAPFRDRVVHHAICNVIEPLFDATFIYDSCACRTDKGTHFGVDRLQKFIRALPESGNYYALKCDVKNYFGSINHGILMDILSRKIRDEKLFSLLSKIVDSTPGPKGIPIGNLTSQLFANVYLNELDYFAKHTLRAKYYVRYSESLRGPIHEFAHYLLVDISREFMDDFVFLGQKEELHTAKAKIAEFLTQQLDLVLHPKKANVLPVRCGVDFCGYAVFRSHRKLRASSVRRFARKLRRMRKSGIAVPEKTVESWLAHAMHADTFGLQKKLLGGVPVRASS